MRFVVYIFIGLFACLGESLSGQDLPLTVYSPSSVSVGFTAPDTICVGGIVNIQNQSTGGVSYYWSFCSGNTVYNPVGVNIGNPGNLLNIPVYMTLVQDAGGCYSFITNEGSKSLTRYFHGTSFNNPPVSWTNLGSFGMIGDSVEGLRIRNDNGQWIGIINNNNRLVRLNFGTSVANTPTASLLGPYSMLNTAHCLEILNENGTWIGYLTCTWGNNLVRLNFGNSLLNTPVLTNLGTVGGVLNMPSFFSMIKENLNWYAIVISSGSNHARLEWGNSLLNNPTATSLGQVCGNIPLGGIALIRDCDATTGFQLNYTASSGTVNEMYRINFPAGITGSITSTPLGNIGNMNKPHEFSEIVRVGDTLFTYVTNRQNHTLTRLSFLPCTNASVVSSILFTPPPFSYNSTGTYNIQLIVNEGLPDQVSLCKPIVVVNPPTVNLGSDQSVCEGTTVTLDAGPGFSSYLWSTGATTRTIQVSTTGNYSVSATKWGCQATDAVQVTFITPPPLDLGPDIEICQGLSHTFDAGSCSNCTFQWDNLTLGLMNIGSAQTYTTSQAGNYQVKKTNSAGCFSIDQVLLSVLLNTNVDVLITASQNPVCEGASVVFTAVPVNGGSSPGYQWQVNGVLTGTNSSTFTYTPSNNDHVSCLLTSSNPSCTVNNPALSNSVFMQVNQNNQVGLTITAASNQICEGTSVEFTASPANGGSNPSFQWLVNGINSGTNSQTFTYTPANGDVVSCILTTSLSTCVTNNPATSNILTMVVYPNYTVSVNIAASMITVCAGSTVQFIANPANGGLNPGFQWKVNGVNTGTNSSVFQYPPSNADVVTCTLTSSYSECTLNNPATSNPISLTVNQFQAVDVSISASANPLCSGESVTINALGINGGNSPVYQWKVNNNIVGTDNPQYSFQPLTGDQVLCTMLSDLPCTVNNPAASNTVTMLVNPLPYVSFTTCTDTMTTLNARPFKLKGGIPAGGTYSGSGVNSGTGYFDPSSAGTGKKTIDYSYLSYQGCSKSVAFYIHVEPVQNFICGQSFTDIRDGRSYETVLYGGRCWMQKNLNYGTQIPGTAEQTDNCIPEKYCYNDVFSKCSSYGGLYQWDEIMAYENTPGSTGICPPGWHVPTPAEWMTLMNANLTQGMAGKPLQDSIINGFRVTESGFNYSNAIWKYQGFGTFFWTSEKLGTNRALAHGMNRQNFSVSDYFALRSNAFAVRCLKD